MSVEIRRTTVTPTEGGSVVQLHISDVQPEDASASFVLQLSVSLPMYEKPLLLAQAQREAVKAAQRVLSDHLQKLASEIGRGDFPNLEPYVKSD